jgi:hypothetical protein
LVKWKGFNQEENSWEVGPNISANALKTFWKRRDILPKRRTKATPKPKRRGRLQNKERR